MELETCLRFINTADVAHDELMNSLAIAKRVTDDLSRLLTFEYKYQNGQINEDTLVRFHERYLKEKDVKNSRGS